MNFYHQFSERFLHHARPLFELTKKDTEWSWSNREQGAFDGLKQRFTLTPILHFADNDCPYQVEADSLDVVTGAVLSQQSPKAGKWHPVAFYSNSLTPVEQNYEIHDKEMLAII